MASPPLESSAQTPDIMNQIAVLSRWIARVFSVLIFLFWGFFIVMHLVGEEGRPSRPLVLQDFLLMGGLGLSLLGLAIAWKRERAGSLLTLVCVAIGAVVNWRILAFPNALIPFTAILFLVASCLGSARKARPVEVNG